MCLNHKSSRPLQDVFKTYSRCFQSVLLRRFQDVMEEVFKKSSRHFEDVFKTSSRRLAKIFSRHFQGVFKTCSRHLQDAFKMCHQNELFLLTRLQYVFKRFSRRIQYFAETCYEDNYLQKDLSRPHFWEIYGQGKNFSGVSSLDILNVLEQFL